MQKRDSSRKTNSAVVIDLEDMRNEENDDCKPEQHISDRNTSPNKRLHDTVEVIDLDPSPRKLPRISSSDGEDHDSVVKAMISTNSRSDARCNESNKTEKL